jgi:hypothetical protein
MKIICRMLEKEESRRISWFELRKELFKLKDTIGANSLQFAEELNESIPPITVKAGCEKKQISDQIKWVFCNTEVVVKTANEAFNANDMLLLAAKDIEIIQRYLDLNSRLCNLFMMAIYKLQALADDLTLADISHWIEIVRTFVCIKVYAVSKYCHDRLQTKNPFTQFLSNTFHQNGFATQYSNEFYELTINSSIIREEAARRADIKFSEKLNSVPGYLQNQELIKYRDELNSVMSKVGFHPKYQDYFRDAMSRTISLFKKGEKKYSAASGNFKQAIALVHLAENYNASMVETAKKGQCDGFANIYSLSESEDMIEDIFDFAAKHYSSSQK